MTVEMSVVTVRYLLTLFSTLIVVYLAVISLNSIAEPVTYVDIPHNDLILAGANLLIEQSKGRLQIGLVLIGLLWGLILAKPGEARIVLSDKPELILFSLSSTLLIMSFWLHAVYIERMASAFSRAGKMETTGSALTMPDVFGLGFSDIYEIQLTTLIAGAGVAILTLFSAHRLKR